MRIFLETFQLVKVKIARHKLRVTVDMKIVLEKAKINKFMFAVEQQIQPSVYTALLM